MPNSTTGIVVGQSPVKRFGQRLLGNPNETMSKSFLSTIRRVVGTRTTIPDPRYTAYLSETTRPEEITASTLLSKGVPLATFLGSPGDRTSLDSFPLVKLQQERILQQLYLHAQLLEYINNHPNFENNRLVVVESLFRKPFSDGTFETGTSDNALKANGRLVGYRLLNSAGDVDHEKTFEAAVLLKDNFYYDKLCLDYDTFDPKGGLNVNIMVYMPELDNFTGYYHYQLQTKFNRFIYASTELSKLLPYNVL
jgi:hypothetical protein